jgi:hypothetical protein
MFRIPLSIDITKKRKIIGFTIFIVIIIITFIFQMLFNCQHQESEYNSFLCKRKKYLKGDNIQTTFTDITLIANDIFEYYNQTLIYEPKEIYYLYMTINSGSYGYTSFGGEVLINNVSTSISKIGMPDTDQSRLWDDYINKFLYKNNVTYIYWDPYENNLDVTFINGDHKKYNNGNMVNEMIKKDISRILEHELFSISLSYTCTSCFRKGEFKFENLWNVAMGFGTLSFTFYNLLRFFISFGINSNVEYKVVNNNENINECNYVKLQKSKEK